ncbi:MAG: PilZ domain-containing protein [Candidatus Omnitrophota bacterium]
MSLKKTESAQNTKVVGPSQSAISETFQCWRRAERFLCSLQGNLVLSETQSYPVQCRDISVQGASIFSPVHLPSRSHVTLKFSTKEKVSFVLNGCVCWCKKVRDGWHVGVKFDRALPFELKKLLGPGLRYREYVSVL